MEKRRVYKGPQISEGAFEEGEEGGGNLSTGGKFLKEARKESESREPNKRTLLLQKWQGEKKKKELGGKKRE